MQTEFKVDSEFIMEAYKAACQGWKQRIEEKFPDLFKKVLKKQEVIYQSWADGELEETKKYYFAIGDKVKVTDGSYNLDAHTNEERSGIDDLFKYNTAEIIALNTGKIYKWETQHKRENTLNLLLKFPKGILVYCAPNCVNKASN